MTPKRAEYLDMSIVISVFSQETLQNTKKKKLNCEILQEITFHWMTMEFLKLRTYLLMNQN